MKENKCPYCHSPIQENASFCLTCMKSLDEKRVIEKQKRKSKIIIPFVICISLVIVLLLILTFYLLNRHKTNTVHYNKNTIADYSSDENQNNGNLNNSDDNNTNSKNSTGNKVLTAITDFLHITNSSKPKETELETSSSQKPINEENKNATEERTSSTENTEKPEDTPTHTHSFSSKTTKSATCVSDGEKTYTCSCGASYTEKISATGHNWLEVTETVHHDEVGDYEYVKVADTYTWYRCPQCNKLFYNLDEYYVHFDGIHVPSDPWIKYIREDYVHGTVPAEYEKRWVVKKEAYDEQVVVGYKCSICGKTK